MSLNLTVRRRLARNTASNFAGAAIPIAIGFFLMPFIIHRIGISAYGIWILSTTVIGYTGLISLGLGPTVTKKSAEYLALKDTVGLNRMLNTVFVLYLCLGLMVGTIAYVLGPLLPQVFHTAQEKAEQLKLVLWLVGLQAALGFPFAIFGGLMHGLQDFHISNTITILNAILRLIGTVFLLIKGFGLISLLLLELGLSSIRWTFQTMWVKRRIPTLELHLGRFDRKQVRHLLRFCGAMFLWRVAGMTIHRSSRIIIGLFLPVSNITLYEVGNKAAEYPRLGFMSFLSPLLPATSELETRGASSSLRKLYLSGSKFVFAFYAGAAAALLFWGDAFINLWMGNQFEISAAIMQVLLLGYVYQSQNVVAHVMLPGMGMLKAFTRVMAGYPIVNIAFSVTLVYFFGVIGIAWAATLTLIVLETYLLGKVLRIFKVSFVELLRACHLPTFLSLTPAVFFAYVQRLVFPVATWGELAEVGALFFATYGASFWFWGMSQDEKRVLKDAAGAFVCWRKSTL